MKIGDRFIEAFAVLFGISVTLPLHAFASQAVSVSFPKTVAKETQSVSVSTDVQTVETQVSTETSTDIVTEIVAPAEEKPKANSSTASDDLNVAIDTCDIEKIKLSLKAGADPNKRSKYFNSPLDLAMKFCLSEPDKFPPVLQEKKVLDILRLLIKAGAVPKKNCELLESSAVNGGLRVAEYLIQNGANINGCKEIKRQLRKIEGLFVGGPSYSLIAIATEFEHPEITQLLISHGAEPISKQDTLQIKLNIFAKKGNLEKVISLVKEGAEVNSMGEYMDKTALIEAINWYNLSFYDQELEKVILWLLKAGADPNINDKGLYKAPALWHATHVYYKWFHPVVLNALLEHGARVSKKNALGDTPLHNAAKLHNSLATKILIDAGAKVMDRNRKGETPLDLAEEGKIIKLLKAAGAVE